MNIFHIKCQHVVFNKNSSYYLLLHILIEKFKSKAVASILAYNCLCVLNVHDIVVKSMFHQKSYCDETSMKHKFVKQYASYRYGQCKNLRRLF